MAVYTSTFTGQGIDEALGKIRTLETNLTTLESKEDEAIAGLKARIEALEAELKGSTPGPTPGSTPEQGTDQGTNSGTGGGSSEPTEPSEPTEGSVEGTPEEEIPEQNA